MMHKISNIFMTIILVLLIVSNASFGASIIVAASDSLASGKAHADYVCDGTDDHVELLQSITAHAIISDVDILLDDGTTVTVQHCYTKHSVEWLQGTYNLGAALIIPNASDLVIKAEGANIIGTSLNSAVVIRGMNRCQYYFGRIFNNKKDDTAAALRIRPSQGMPACYSKIGFTGLRGIETAPDSNVYNGTGLHLVPSGGRIFANEFKGTDISRLNIGIEIDDALEACKGNWFWASVIYATYRCIHESGVNVWGNTWEVNLDIGIPELLALGAECVRTAASYGKWYMIMYVGPANNALVLEPGASHNLMEMHPPFDDWLWEDNSGNQTNVFLDAKRPPYKQ